MVKGLIRNCTDHHGNFEMLGTRCSQQSNGNMLCLQDKVDQHHYYREIMSVLLLKEVKIILRKETGITSNKYRSLVVFTVYLIQ